MKKIQIIVFTFTLIISLINNTLYAQTKTKKIKSKKEEAYTSSGKLIVYAVWTYDTNENKIKNEEFTKEGKLSCLRNYIYDKKNNLIDEEYKDKKGWSSHNYYSYDENSNLIQKIDYYHNGTIREIIKYAYNSDNKLILKVKCKNFGSTNWYNKYYYKSKGQKIIIKTYNKDRDFQGHTISFKDKNGNLINSKNYRKDGSLIGYHKSTYNLKNKITHEEIRDVIVNYDMIYTYNADGYLIKEERYDYHKIKETHFKVNIFGLITWVVIIIIGTFVFILYLKNYFLKIVISRRVLNFTGIVILILLFILTIILNIRVNKTKLIKNKIPDYYIYKYNKNGDKIKHEHYVDNELIQIAKWHYK